MSSINPNGNNPISNPLGGGGSKEEKEPSVSHPFEGADPAIASVAAGALGGALKATKAHEVTSDLFDYKASQVETVEEYLSLCLQRVRTHLVEKAQLRINPEIGKNVLLLLTPLAGFGDILFIYKAAQALKADSFNVSIRIVEVDKRDPLMVKEQLEKMANMEDIEILTPDSEESDFKPDCVIIAPTIPKDGVIDEVVKPLGVPFEKIYEYGGNKSCYEMQNPIIKYGSMEIMEEAIGGGVVLSGYVPFDIGRYMDNLPIKSGMGVGELGIFTENGLIKPLSKEEKAEKLDVMAINFPEKLDPILKDRSGKDYLDSTNLFFGYAHREDSMQKFVHTIAFLNKGEKLNIDIILPWRLENIYDGSKTYKKCVYRKYKLAEAGIGRIEIIHSGGIFSENISHDGVGKVLRIINLFQFTNPQIRDLLAVSEAPVLTTGDQSLNEALLFSKLPLYETMEWKYSLDQSLIKKSIPYPHVFNVFSNDSWEAEGITHCTQESFEGSQMQLFHASIINPNNSLEKSLCNEALRLSALGKNRKFKAESEKLENKIKEVFKIPFLVRIIADVFESRIHILGPISQVVLNSFKSKFNEIDKKKLPLEVIQSIEELISIGEKSNRRRFTEEALTLGLKIQKLLLDLIQDKLKQIKL